MIFEEIDNLELSSKFKKYLKRVYLLGYDVGYFSHDEKSSWIRDARRSIMKYAKKHNIKNEVIRYYKQGRLDGTTKAQMDLDQLKVRKGRYLQPDVDEEFSIERPYRYVYDGLPQCLIGIRSLNIPGWTHLTPQLSNIPVKKYTDTRKYYLES